MKIIGVDPGLANTGVGVIEQDGNELRLIEYSCINTKAGEPFTERLLKIYDEFSVIMDRVCPDACAVESVFFAKNAKSAFQLGHARAVVMVRAAKAGISVHEYSPQQIKKAIVGGGRAEKSQVQYMTKMLLKLDDIPKPDHAADALGIAICHANMSRFLGLTRSNG